MDKRTAALKMVSLTAAVVNKPLAPTTTNSLCRSAHTPTSVGIKLDPPSAAMHRTHLIEPS